MPLATIGDRWKRLRVTANLLPYTAYPDTVRAPSQAMLLMLIEDRCRSCWTMAEAGRDCLRLRESRLLNSTRPSHCTHQPYSRTSNCPHWYSGTSSHANAYATVPNSLLDRITDALSKKMVRKVKNRWGAEIWP